ncbi:hypothetical protein HMPREF0577_1944 [Mobiluncus mulieris ATCC 35243]|nr:hypothetical protein HMPREF0577_1944 [Mobiluncus mulieris ATCC 35243]
MKKRTGESKIFAYYQAQRRVVCGKKLMIVDLTGINLWITCGLKV